MTQKKRSSRSSRNLRVVYAALATLAVVASGSALADDKGGGDKGGGGGGQVEVQLNVKVQDPGGKYKDDAPTIEATVIGGPATPMDQFTLSEANAKIPVTIKASAKREYAQGNETIAIALVINGQEVWVGNDEIEPEDSPSRYVGILKGLKVALQNVPFATAGPQGSKGVLITYADKAEIKVPMGPLSNLTAEALGGEKDYRNKAGTAMVAGIESALTELHSVSVSRKALIIVGDGTDTNPENAPSQLSALKKQAAADHVQTFAIIYKGALSGDKNVIASFVPAPRTVTSADDIATTIKSILERMGDRYYLTFPGFDKTLGLGLPWDGKPHDLVIHIGKEDEDAVNITLAPKWSPPQPMSLWWLWIVIPVGVLLLIIIAIKVFSKAPQPVAMPAPVMAAAAPAAPEPSFKPKTVAISMTGADDGFPLVGWLVPLNGANAFQTMRLRSTITKIGTTAPADVVINDGFMSTEHCQISCSPQQGFVLIDGGSTNGSYVNDKKVSRHDLLDNDVITLGKTNLKFKSIS